MAKGSASLKKVTEHITRLSMQVGAGERIVVQGDPEPAVKQVINSVEACRVKLGLATDTRLAPRGSHASNGLAEKAVDTVRRNALTLKAHVEDRIKAKIGGHCPIFAWLLRHTAFLHNRFFVTGKGAPPFEILHGRQYKGKLIVFGEQCIFHKPSKYKGDVQWHRGIWVGVNERNGAHVLLTNEGAFESRSIRRLPGEEQWSAEAVLQAQGLPWDYKGKLKRKKALCASARAPLLPDNATLEELARAAGKAAAETIVAATPNLRRHDDEAGSDPETSSVPSMGVLRRAVLEHNQKPEQFQSNPREHRQRKQKQFQFRPKREHKQRPKQFQSNPGEHRQRKQKQFQFPGQVKA